METILECGEGERLVINEDIVLSVVEVTDDEVCLKIELPEGTRVWVEGAYDNVMGRTS